MSLYYKNIYKKCRVATKVNAITDLISVHDKWEESGGSCESNNPWARGEKQVFPC